METKQSPPPTVKRHMNSGHNWREFIEREHDTVDHLIQDSFANYCKNLNRNQTQPQSQQAETHRNRNGGFGSPSSNDLIQGNSYVGSLARSSSRKSASPPKQSSSHLSHLTMPRRSPPKTSGDLVASRKTLMDELNDANQQLAELIRDDLPENNIPRVQETAPELPPGIQELESLYAPMKNLLHPLPNARKYSGHSMPLPHPLERDGCRDAVAALPTYPSAYPRGRSSPPEEDEISVISVVNDIPPPLPPVQSHAVLQESLGHEIPRTPLLRKAQLQSKSHLHHGLGSATSGRGKLFKPSLDSSDWGRTPPLPPKRTSSKLSLLPNSASSSRPRHLSLDPNGSCGIYANTKSLLHR